MPLSSRRCVEDGQRQSLKFYDQQFVCISLFLFLVTPAVNGHLVEHFKFSLTMT